MIIFKTISLTFLSIIIIFIVSRTLGNKLISQLNIFDYITGITIGSLAATIATNANDDFRLPLTALITYGIVSFSVKTIAKHSVAFRRILTKKPLILFENGKIYYDNLRKAQLTINEFLMLCRNEGYFDLSKLYLVVIEHNGKLSIIPEVSSQPVLRKDLNLSLSQETQMATLIIDGTLLLKNLKNINKNETWLKDRLKSHCINNIENIFLATYCKDNDKLLIYNRIKSKDEDIFC